jgi:hypothetical protein
MVDTRYFIVNQDSIAANVDNISRRSRYSERRYQRKRWVNDRGCPMLWLRWRRWSWYARQRTTKAYTQPQKASYLVVISLTMILYTHHDTSHCYSFIIGRPLLLSRCYLGLLDEYTLDTGIWIDMYPNGTSYYKPTLMILDTRVYTRPWPCHSNQHARCTIRPTAYSTLDVD